MKFVYKIFSLMFLLCSSYIFAMEKDNSKILNQFLGIKPLEDIVLDYIGHEEWVLEKTLVHPGEISSVAISADSSIFVTACNNIVKLWSYDNLTCFKTIALPKEFRAHRARCPIAVIDDLKETAEHVTYYVTLPDGAKEPKVQSVGISRDNKYLAMFLDNNYVEIRDIATEKRLRHFRMNRMEDEDIAKFKSTISFSPDNKFLCIYGHEGNSRNYTFQILNLQQKNRDDAFIYLRCFKTLPITDDTHYQGTYNDINQLWDIFSGNSFFANGLFAPSTSPYSYCSFMERIIGFVGPKNHGNVFVASLFQIKSDAFKNSKLTEEEKQGVTAQTNTDFHKYLKNMEKLLKYCASNGFEEFKYITKLNAEIQEISSLAYSPDGRYFLTGSEDKTVKVWKNQRAEMSAKIIFNNEFKSIVLN